MNTSNLKPEKVTKPIQLLAAWLLGLVLINSSFLAAASQIESPFWGPAALIIASIVNVPIFLFSLFMLQTKYRPEMQEDPYYSQYLAQKSSKNSDVSEPKFKFETDKLAKEIISKINTDQPDEKEKEIKQIIQNRDIQFIEREVNKSPLLSELFINPKNWSAFIDKWENNIDFKNDVITLDKYDLLKGDIHQPETLKLSGLGNEIAKDLAQKELLWNQIHGNRD